MARLSIASLILYGVCCASFVTKSRVFNVEHGVTIMADTLIQVEVYHMEECSLFCLQTRRCDAAVFYPSGNVPRHVCDLKDGSSIKKKISGNSYRDYSVIFTGEWVVQHYPNTCVWGYDDVSLNGIYSLEVCWALCTAETQFKCQLIEVTSFGVCAMSKDTLASVNPSSIKINSPESCDQADAMGLAYIPRD